LPPQPEEVVVPCQPLQPELPGWLEVVRQVSVKMVPAPAPGNQ
jgi:hypothetical protein